MRDITTRLVNCRRWHMNVIVAVALVLGVCGISAAALPPAAKIVPPETIALIECEDFSVFQGQCRHMSFYKLLHDPTMKAFVDHVKENLRSELANSSEGVLQTIMDIEALPQGKVAFAVVLKQPQAGSDLSKSGQLLAITQWGDAIDRVKDSIDEILQKAADEDARIQDEEYRGLTIKTVGPSSEESLSYTMDEDWLMIATNAETLRFAVAQIKAAGSGTLAGETSYMNARKSLAPYSPGHVNVFVDINRIMDTALAAAKTAPPKAIIGALGLDKFMSLSLKRGPGKVAPSAREYSYGQAFLQIDGPKTGVSKILDLKSLPIEAPRFVSEDVLSMFQINIDFAGAFDEIYKIAAGINPQIAALMNMPLVPPSPQGDPGVTLRKDVFAYLGSQLTVTQRLDENAANDAAPMQTSNLIAVAQTNRTGLERSVSRLHSQFLPGQNGSTTRELLGHTLYLIDLSMFMPRMNPAAPSRSSVGATRMAAGPGPSAPVMPIPRMALAVTDTHLLFGPETSVERAIRVLTTPSDQSLGRAAWFTRAKAQIPSAAGMAGFENTAVSGKFLWQMLKQAASQQTEATGSDDNSVTLKLGPNIMLPPQAMKVFDFSLLPDFDAVKKYFGLSATYGVSRPDGFFAEFKYVENN